VLVDAAAPLWTLLVGRDYRAGSQLLPGLLAMFLAASLPAIMTIHAKLRERPYMVALLAAAGVAATVGVGRWIVPAYGEVGMAYAAGAGMTLAAIVVSWAYFRLADSTWLRPASWIWLGLPVLLMLAGALGRLLGGPVAGLVLLAAWTVLLAAVVRSRRVFSRYERQLLATAAGGLLQRIRRLGRRR
jgi:O-antigen/teichoic acid export membrane protein